MRVQLGKCCFLLPPFPVFAVARADYVTGGRDFNGTKSRMEHSDAA